MRLCQEVLAHGMILLRAAAERALQDIDPPELETPIPGSAATAIAMAKDRARRRVPNNAVLFTRLSRAIRQTIALQALIAAGYPPPPPPPRAPRPHSPDGPPRTAPAGQAKPRQPDAGLHCDATEHPDWLPTFDPDSQTPVEDLLHKIARDMDEAHTRPPSPDDPPPQPNPERTRPQHRPPPHAARQTRAAWRPPAPHHADG